MSERIDVALREAPGAAPNPPDLLSELKDLLSRLCPEIARSGFLWTRGKGEQEMAKAAEIQASVLEKFGRLELERQKLVHERDQAILNAEKDRERDRMDHALKMREQKSKSLMDIIAAAEKLKDLGVPISARMAKGIERAILHALEEE